MAYRLAWILVLGVLLLSLAWLLRGLEPHQDTVFSGYRGAARHDRFFAAQRFLERVDIPARSGRELSDIFPLPATDATIISTTTRRGLPDGRRRQLIDWVRAGGHLWVIPETRYTDDPVADAMLDPLGIHAEVVDDEPETVADETALALADDRISVEWGWAYETLAWDPEQPPQWSVSVRGHPVMAEYRVGAGLILVMTDIYFANNDSLDSADNAAGLWYLLTRHRVPTEVIFVLSDEMPALPRWLARNAGPVLAAGAVLILLALWRAIPRFGPLRRRVETQHRSLGQHLSASGRYYRRSGHVRQQLERLRHSTWLRLRQRWRDLPEEISDRALEPLAGRLQLDAAVLRRAFLETGSDRDDQLAESLRALQTIRNQS